jgi:hypothetical protein
MKRLSGGLVAAKSLRASKSESRGVGVLIDLHILDGGGGDARAVGLDAIHDQGDAIGADGVVIEKAGEQGDVILIEDRNTVESFAIDIVVRGDLMSRVFGVDVDGFVERSDLENQAERGKRLCGEGEISDSVFEADGLNLKTIFTARNIVDMERASWPVLVRMTERT